MDLCSPSRAPLRQRKLSPMAAGVDTEETRLLRVIGLCTASILLLDIWAWISPGMLARSGTEHTVSDFDPSSFFYLFPFTLHALAGLWFFTRKQCQPLPFWRRVVRLRLFALLCLALAVPALVSRVVTLRTYCHLNGKIEEEVEEGSAFKACTSARMTNTSVMAVVYAVLGVSMVQALIELEALTKWRYQYQCNPCSYNRPFLPSTLPPYVSASSSISTSACSLSSSANKEGGDEEGDEGLHSARTVYDDNRALFGDVTFYEDGTSPSPDGSLPPPLTPSPPVGKGVMGSSERSAFSSYVAGSCV